jgi:putative ABC transport system permease protein
MIHIPGITAGMILAGMAPLAAVSMQLVVMLMLTAAVSISVASAVVLAGPRALRFPARTMA